MQGDIMETIIFALVIIGSAIGLIYFYNRDSKNPGIGKVDRHDTAPKTPEEPTPNARDDKDLALSLESESAARATAALEKTKRPRKPTVKSAAKTTAKKPTTKTTKSRTPRSGK
jgi:hypothetical protein